MTTQTKLSTKTKFIFGLGDFPTVAALTARSFFWLIFMTEIAGLPIELAGTVVAVGRLWDAVNDPLVGMLSDRMESKFGRRRPFFLIGALPLGISFFFSFFAPNLGSDLAHTIYFIVVFLIFDTSFTIINVPYSALTAELTQDYDERTSLAGWRMGAAMLATLITASLFSLLAEGPLAALTGSDRWGYAAVAAIWGAVMVIVPLILFFNIEEPDADPDDEPINFVKTFREVFKNESFKWGAIIYLLTFTAVDIIAAIFVFFVLHAVGFPDGQGIGSIVLGVVILSAFLFMPVVVRLTGRFGKRKTYMACMAVWSVIMIGIGFVPSGSSLTTMLVLGAIAGLGYAAANAIPWSIVADVIEEDEWNTGKRREGIYAGYLVFFRKLTAGFAVFLVSQTLGRLGFNEPVKSAESIQALRIFIGIVPAILLACSIWAANRYPMTKEAHAELLRKLEKRRAEQQTGASIQPAGGD